MTGTSFVTLNECNRRLNVLRSQIQSLQRIVDAQSEVVAKLRRERDIAVIDAADARRALAEQKEFSWTR